MSSALLTEYRTHLAQGHTHHEALNALTRRFDLDRATINRLVAQAQAQEARTHKETNAT